MVYLKLLVKQMIPFTIKLGMIFLAIILLVFIGSSLVFTSASNNLTPHSAREMSVNGTAKRKVTPDSARIVLGKNMRGDNIADLQTKAGTAVNELVSKLKAAGVKEEQIRTSNYSVSPVYDNNGDVKTYAINISVEIDLEKVNPQQELLTNIIKAGTESGINEVSSLSFYLADYDQAVKDLQDEAIADARKNALSQTQAAGANLGKVLSINSGYYYPTYYSMDRAAGSSAAPAPANSGDIKFNAGQLDLQANVTVTYELY